jgi:hypothetical protein
MLLAEDVQDDAFLVAGYTASQACIRDLGHSLPLMTKPFDTQTLLRKVRTTMGSAAGD